MFVSKWTDGKENVDSSVPLFNRYNEHPIVRARGCAARGGDRGLILDALPEEWAVYLYRTLFHLKLWHSAILSTTFLEHKNTKVTKLAKLGKLIAVGKRRQFKHTSWAIYTWKQHVLPFHILPLMKNFTQTSFQRSVYYRV